jgi:hypothetical protein
MLGQISQVVGKSPHYPIMALQGVISQANNVTKFMDLHKTYKATLKEYGDHNFSPEQFDDLNEAFEKKTSWFQHKEQKKDGSWEVNRFANSLAKNSKHQMRVPTLDEFGSEMVMGQTLGNHCGTETHTEDYGAMSRRIIHGLGFVNEEMNLVIDHNTATMVWELGGKRRDGN